MQQPVCVPGFGLPPDDPPTGVEPQRRAHHRARILLWSTLCFVMLALNNILLFVDLAILPTVDLSPYRNITAALAAILIVFGLIWDSE